MFSNNVELQDHRGVLTLLQSMVQLPMVEKMSTLNEGIVTIQTKILYTYSRYKNMNNDEYEKIMNNSFFIKISSKIN